ncbi:MAG: hypothetical protein DRJ35_01245 [Thermoprotei archaeon]|nr:MAG: hypothetical protein DRJ35_01245 [Thermoprotei archaeon]
MEESLRNKHINEKEHVENFPWKATIVKYAEESITYSTIAPLYEDSLRTIKEKLLKRGVYVEIRHKFGKIEKGAILLEVIVRAKTWSQLSWGVDKVLKEIDNYLLVWKKS